MGINKWILLLKSYELVIWGKSHTAEFTAADRQFGWLEISLIDNKSNQHKTVYDSNNAEAASTTIQNVIIENTSNTYSTGNELKYDVDDVDEKHQLYKIFLASCCNGCIIALLTDYANNPLAREVPQKKITFLTLTKGSM